MDEIKDVISENLTPEQRMLIAIGEIRGVEIQHQKSREALNSYWETTRFSLMYESASENPNWDAGFLAAMSILEKSKHVGNSKD